MLVLVSVLVPILVFVLVLLLVLVLVNNLSVLAGTTLDAWGGDACGDHETITH